MSVTAVALHEAASQRYLNYALSVITARALPDVRDGLKPVQRRILYTMYRELNLDPEGRYRKCAAVVGEVMGKYHPHGDSSIYEALVRMAQDFSLAVPLVDGQGNFGSLDGDPAAAMRYTECRLASAARELLTELDQRTVPVRPTYDGQRVEPVVLPAQFPHLLVNGCEGIAVGMATRIPPHHLGEVISAAVRLIDDRQAPLEALLEDIQGPDFPTGGRILATRDEIRDAYATGQGSLKVQAEWAVEKDGRRTQVVIRSVPYGSNKARLVEDIADHVREKRLPQLVDVRDESTEDVRVVLELRAGATPEEVMAWLYRRTGLQTTFPINLTALVPADESGDATAPVRLDLRTALLFWLDFRHDTVRKRLEFELATLRERIEVLEGFARIFDALDEAIALIRRSEGRRDARERLMDRFDLSELQADAILDLRLYRLASLEIRLVLEELAEKRAAADRIATVLASDEELWATVRGELLALRSAYGRPRRTTVVAPAAAVLTFEESAYIVDEDAYVVVTKDGWIKRQASFSDLGRIRVREDDAIAVLLRVRTRSTLTFLTSAGSAYTMRVDDVPNTTGHGEPLQRRFAFADGERVVGVLSHDVRHRPAQVALPLGDDPPGPYAFAITAHGRVLRFATAAHEEPSTRNGRKYARLDGEDTVFLASAVRPGDRVCIATLRGRAAVFGADEVGVLRAAGKGVTGIKLREDDTVMALVLAPDAETGAAVVTAQGRELVVCEKKFGLGPRGGRGHVVLQRGTIDVWKRGPIILLGPSDPAEA